MQLFEGPTEHQPQLGRVRATQRGLAQAIGQRAAREQLDHQVWAFAKCFDAVYRRQVRVTDGRHGLCLAPEAHGLPARYLGESLDGYGP